MSWNVCFGQMMAILLQQEILDEIVFFWRESVLKSPIRFEPAIESRILGCGKLCRINAEKVPLGHVMECIFWSNDRHSTAIRNLG
jgi:hypothetical protein